MNLEELIQKLTEIRDEEGIGLEIIFAHSFRMYKVTEVMLDNDGLYVELHGRPIHSEG